MISIYTGPLQVTLISIPVDQLERPRVNSSIVLEGSASKILDDQETKLSDSSVPELRVS